MKEISVEDLKIIQLKILNQVDVFCIKYGIKYFLCGGTLIGAVRHKGYIPWDDDIDICMPRPDWDRFVDLFSKENNTDYKVYSHLIDKNYILPYAKVSYEKTILKEHVAHPLAIGVNIDVFPLDTIPENYKLQWLIYTKFKLYYGMHQLKQIIWSSNRTLFKNLIVCFSKCILFGVSYSYIVEKMHTNAIRYRNKKSSLCGGVVWGYGMKEITSKDNYREQIKAEFEGMFYPIPSGYDAILKSIYGDYRQLPPEEEQVTHHDFIAYWK